MNRKQKMKGKIEFTSEKRTNKNVFAHVELISSAFKLYRLILCRCFHFFFSMNLVRFNSIAFPISLDRTTLYIHNANTPNTHPYIQNSRNLLHLLYIYLFVLSFVSCYLMYLLGASFLFYHHHGDWIYVVANVKRFDKKKHRRQDEISVCVCVCACHRHRRYRTRPK